MQLALALLISFLLGSFPTAYVFVKKIKGIDIRKEGSGNVGATNAIRVIGKGPGIAVFIIDFLKGFIPSFALSRLCAGYNLEQTSLLLGGAAILGHIFTPFLGFRGGKGVATGAGVICASFPLFFLISMLIWYVSFRITRIVSISSILSTGALFILSLLWKKDVYISALFLAMSALIIWTHRSNLSRIIQKKENRA